MTKVSFISKGLEHVISVSVFRSKTVQMGPKLQNIYFYLGRTIHRNEYQK